MATFWLTESVQDTCQVESMEAHVLPFIHAILWHCFKIDCSSLSLLHRNQTEGWQCCPTRRKSPSIGRSHIWVESLPCLNRVVDTLFHCQGDEWQCQESIDSHWRSSNRLDHTDSHSLGMSETKCGEWNHGGSCRVHPSDIVAIVHFLHSCWRCFWCRGCRRLGWRT